MKLSPKTRYAIRIVFELAEADKPISIAALSEKTGITLRTVENISTVLRTHKVTSSVMGASGGLVLEVPLSQLSLGDMINYFDHGVEFAVCCGDKSNDCPNQTKCANRATWYTVSAQIQQELNSISLHSILPQYKKGVGNKNAACK